MALRADGLWVRVRRRAWGMALRPALFLDRDGVIVEEVGFLSRPEQLRLIAGAAAVIAAANRAGIPVIVVTNQSGVGRGLFGWEEYARVEAALAAQLAAAGAWLDAVLACPFHPAARPPYAAADHPARKPNPGMLLIAARQLPVALERSWIVGDRAADLAAGRNAGLAGGLHVATGFGAAAEERAAALALAERDFTVIAAPSIAAARALPLFGGDGLGRLG